MPSELKKPEPAAALLGLTIVGLGTVRLLSGVTHEEGAKFWTDAQLEQYAADRVREALERAAQECDRLTHALDNAGTSYHRPATADRCARAIRTLKEQTK